MPRSLSACAIARVVCPASGVTIARRDSGMPVGPDFNRFSQFSRGSIALANLGAAELAGFKSLGEPWADTTAGGLNFRA